MNSKNFSLRRHAALLSGACFLLAGAATRGSEGPNADAFPNFESYIKVTGRAVDVTGNKAAFQTRDKCAADGSYGIEDFHYTRDTSKTTTVTVDGHALSGAEDYLGQVNVAKNEVGTVEVGYKRFRTFYDGTGGFFPLSNQWMPLKTEDLHVDRAKFWVEAKLALPKAPTFTARYTNELRNGRKDSTEWGSADLTGLPFTVAPNPVSEVRKGSPDYLQIGERHENLTLTVQHKIGRTDFALTLLGDRTRNLDTRFVTNFPGEMIPWSIASLSNNAPAGQVVSPQAAAKAAAPYTSWNNQAQIIQSDGMATNTTGVTLDTTTELTPTLSLKAAGAYELVYNALSGNRPIFTATDTPTGVNQVATATFQSLLGGVHLKEATGTVAFDYKPTKTLAVKFGVRAEDKWVRGTSTYNVLAASGTPAVIVVSTPRFDYEKQHEKSQTPVVDVRYSGIKDLALYFNGTWLKATGFKNNSSAFNPTTATSGTVALYDEGGARADYTAGANWKPLPALSLRAEVFTKGHRDESTGYGVQVGDYYLLDYRTTGYKVTALTPVTSQLTLNTRFVAQHSTAKVTGFLPTYPAYDSLNGKNYSLNETIDFTPSRQCYFQLSGTVVYNVINTIYPRAGLTVATVNAAGLTTALAYDTNRVLHNSDNNYFSGSFLSGFVVDRTTDADVLVTFYRADNGNAYQEAFTMPYGVALKDFSVKLGLKHKFNDRWVGRAKVGWFDSKNETMGGFTNFHGPLAYLSIEHAL